MAGDVCYNRASLNYLVEHRSHIFQVYELP